MYIKALRFYKKLKVDDEQIVRLRRRVFLFALTLSVLYGGLVLLYHGLCGSGKGHGSSAVPMMHQVTGYHT